MCVLAYVASYHYATSRGPRSLSMSLARPFPSRSFAPVLLAAAASLITLGLAFVRFCPHNISLDAGSPSSRLLASDGPVRSVLHGEPRAHALRCTPMTAFLRRLDPWLTSSHPVAFCLGRTWAGAFVLSAMPPHHPFLLRHSGCRRWLGLELPSAAGTIKKKRRCPSMKEALSSPNTLSLCTQG
jgi:hypothetical protein